MFYLDEMVTPKLITLFYWILLFAFITKGLGDIFLEGDFWRGLVWVVGGSLASRVACEMVVILFRINENLNEINEKTSENDTLSHTSFEKDYYKLCNRFVLGKPCKYGENCYYTHKKICQQIHSKLQQKKDILALLSITEIGFFVSNLEKILT